MYSRCVRVEAHVNTATVATDTLLEACTWSLARSYTSAPSGCGYNYNQYHCFPSPDLLSSQLKLEIQ